MTATDTAPTTDTWTAQLEQLRARYKHVRPPVLAALNILIHDQSISIDDAKAQASLHGVRITAASVSAARTLLSRMDGPTPVAPTTTSAPTRAPRRSRAAEKAVDAETLVRGFVAKLQGQGNAEAERLREAMRKAIAVLQSAVGTVPGLAVALRS
jgi:Asp-tRNA(Asn)/Glu-tRNA(Gln) amidotransferase A subunit family amidase